MFSLEHYSALRDRAGFVERDDVGRLRVRGEDRRFYLHNLLTNDIEGLSAGMVRYAALLTPQGRMITDMHVFEGGDAILMWVPRPLAAGLRDRFDQFIFSEDVQVEEATDETAQIGVYGQNARELVEALSADEEFLSIPSEEFGLGGFELMVPAEKKQRVLSALKAAGAVPVDMEAVEVCRVEAGVPRFLVDMTEDTIPLEAGIEQRAISFTKGCYVGQELIIRILHRGGGRVARKLVQIGFPPGSDVPPPGTRLRAQDRDAGRVTSSVSSPALGAPLALGYVQRELAEPETQVTAVFENGDESAGRVLGR